MDDLLTPYVSQLGKWTHLTQPGPSSGLRAEVKGEEEEEFVCWRDCWLQLVTGKTQRKEENGAEPE